MVFDHGVPIALFNLLNDIYCLMFLGKCQMHRLWAKMI